MNKQKTLAVTVSRDEKVGVWYILSSDVPGLHVEAGTLDELVAIVGDLAPDLIAANLPGLAADTTVCVQHTVTAKSACAA